MSKMDDYEFKPDQQLQWIAWSGEDAAVIKVGNEAPYVKSITVIMESGQMAGVAWALVEPYDGTISKYNLAQCEGVGY